MVRLVLKVIKGVPTWAEDAPMVCPNRHEGGLAPGWGPCPDCGEMVRLWTCRAVEGGGACGEVLVDDAHVHHGRRLS